MDDFIENGRETVVPAEIILHDGWNPFIKRFSDDIAILRLESEIHFNEYIQPICLTSENLGIRNGVVVGWGKEKESERNHVNIPKVLGIPIVSDGVCFRENSLLAKIAWEESFCAGELGVGVCLGDSGGGFFMKFNDKFYFRGFVSSSIISDSGCYTKNFAIYTDVIKYADFIGIKKASSSFKVTPTTTTTNPVPRATRVASFE